MNAILLEGAVLLVVKATLLLAAGGLLVALIRPATASVRHLVWAFTLIGLLALPLLNLGLPSWTVPILPAEAPNAPMVAGSEAGPAAQPAAPSGAEAAVPAPGGAMQRAGPAAPSDGGAATETTGGNLVLTIWMAGTGAVLLWILIGQIGVMRLRRGARPVRDPEWLKETHDLTWMLDISRPVALMRGVGTTTPMTWGMIWPSVLLPSEAEEWGAERRRMVLLHELAHVKRKDCLTQLVAHLACAVFWFHPLVWYAARRLRVERERACDDLVVRAGSSAPDYADHLLHVARSLRSPRASGMAIAMARPSQLEGRLLAVLDAARRRDDPPVAVRIAAIAVIALLAIPLAIVQPGQATSSVGGEAGEERAEERSDPAEEYATGEVEADRSGDDLHWQGTIRPGRTLAVFTMNGPVRAVGVDRSTAGVRGRFSERRNREREVRIETVERDGNVTVCILPEGARCTPDGIVGSSGRGQPGPRTVAVTVEVPRGVALRTETLNGALQIDGIHSDVQALTLNGAIQARAAGRIEAKTLNGAVDVVMGRTDWNGELGLETLNGAIRVRLPANASTALTARTMAGRITSDFPLEVSRRPGVNSASGTIGAGGRSLRLSTMNGGIRIEREGGALPGAVSQTRTETRVERRTETRVERRTEALVDARTEALVDARTEAAIERRTEAEWAEFEAAMEEFGEAMGRRGEAIADSVMATAEFQASMQRFGEEMGAFGAAIAESVTSGVMGAFTGVAAPPAPPEPPKEPLPRYEDEI